MCGRSGSRLLAIFLSFFLVGPWALLGQSARVNPAPLIPPDFPPLRLAAQPPASEFRPIPPRLPVSPPGAIGFPEFARAAGMIFSGTVIRIERDPVGSSQSVASVAITFHVENALRGTTAGRDLTTREWIGLWSSGQRYRVGERVFLFLYPPSKLGLTSCVGGEAGRFGIDGLGRISLSAQQLSVLRNDSILGRKSQVRLADFALALRRAEGGDHVR